MTTKWIFLRFGSPKQSRSHKILWKNYLLKLLFSSFKFNVRDMRQSPRKLYAPFQKVAIKIEMLCAMSVRGRKKENPNIFLARRHNLTTAFNVLIADCMVKMMLVKKAKICSTCVNALHRTHHYASHRNLTWIK